MLSFYGLWFSMCKTRGGLDWKSPKALPASVPSAAGEEMGKGWASLLRAITKGLGGWRGYPFHTEIVGAPWLIKNETVLTAAERRELPGQI